MDDIIDDLLRTLPKNEYMDEDLFDLQLHCYADVREYMRRRFYSGESDWNLGRRRSGLTRRSRRLWDKLEASVNRVKSAGDEGVYLIYDGWRSSIGYLYAKSLDEAVRLGEVLYGYLMSPETTRTRVEFVRHGNEEDMSGMNESLLESYEAKIRSNKKRIEDLRQESIGLRTKIRSVTMVSNQQQSLTENKKSKQFT